MTPEAQFLPGFKARNGLQSWPYISILFYELQQKNEYHGMFFL